MDQAWPRGFVVAGCSTRIESTNSESRLRPRLRKICSSFAAPFRPIGVCAVDARAMVATSAAFALPRADSVSVRRPEPL